MNMHEHTGCVHVLLILMLLFHNGVLIVINVYVETIDVSRFQSQSIATSTLSKTKTQSAASARTQSPDSLNSQSQ